MCFNCCQDISYVSREFIEFITEYCNFQKYHTQVCDLVVLINTREKSKTELFCLYIQAQQAHTASIKAYRRLVTLYARLVQKYSNRGNG